ncbi:PAAR domain-containing protein [Thaumasiovibrio sp. DFM-14]|uniref:PAAR domain-containing protein n=1 Tax=Thaumasiovibrio sp. DFM-14 TaxID=3384792 RepID=UPI0039A2EF1D
MAGIALLQSVCSGHGGYNPRPSITGQPQFLVNGVPVMATGDLFTLHFRPDSPPCGPGSAHGTSKLMINGKPAAKIGDAVSCGSSITTGQPLFNL